MNHAAPNQEIGWKLAHSYASLPDVLFTPSRPVRVREPRLAILNELLASELGIELANLAPEAIAALFAGNDLPADFRPIAQAYAGHQFGSFTMLGDGRAILLAEHQRPAGDLVDIQLKGAGRTRFSRGGDGRAALGPMLREFLISEAMAALGIPTTRSLAVIRTGEPVYRQKNHQGAILVRVAASHIRVGTFEYLAALRDRANLQALADYAILRHYPSIADTLDKYREFLRAVIDRQAALIAQWQLVGFIHGVMNTDNMAISGETIDYGPCAFMNRYDPNTVFSSIDHSGRYAYGNQPRIAHWNLTRFAETLLPLLDPETTKAIDIATEVLAEFPARFDDYWMNGMRRKLGLSASESGDSELITSLFEWMQSANADFTNTFRDLSSTAMPAAEQCREPAFQNWYSQWQERLHREGRSRDDVKASMRYVNPAVIPRNHHVEAALSAAEDAGNMASFQELLAVLKTPFQEPERSAYREPPADECNYRTFCGT